MVAYAKSCIVHTYDYYLCRFHDINLIIVGLFIIANSSITTSFSSLQQPQSQKSSETSDSSSTATSTRHGRPSFLTGDNGERRSVQESNFMSTDGRTYDKTNSHYVAENSGNQRPLAFVANRNNNALSNAEDETDDLLESNTTMTPPPSPQPVNSYAGNLSETAGCKH